MSLPKRRMKHDDRCLFWAESHKGRGSRSDDTGRDTHVDVYIRSESGSWDTKIELFPCSAIAMAEHLENIAYKLRAKFGEFAGDELFIGIYKQRNNV